MTLGLVIFSLYELNGLLLFPAMIFGKINFKPTQNKIFLVALPAFTPLQTNISITPIFPTAASFLIVLISGLFDMAGAVFLVFKD